MSGLDLLRLLDQDRDALRSKWKLLVVLNVAVFLIFILFASVSKANINTLYFAGIILTTSLALVTYSAYHRFIEPFEMHNEKDKKQLQEYVKHLEKEVPY